MKYNWIRILLFGCFALLLAACNGTGVSAVPDEGLAIPAFTQLVANTPTESAMTQPAPPSGMEFLIEKAKEDLARQLSIPVTQIKLIEATSVVWLDASLGCPELGVVYTDLQTAGYLIKLKANSWSYEYHTDTNHQVVFCQENVMKPVEKPGDIKDGKPWMR